MSTNNIVTPQKGDVWITDNGLGYGYPLSIREVVEEDEKWYTIQDIDKYTDISLITNFVGPDAQWVLVWRDGKRWDGA